MASAAAAAVSPLAKRLAGLAKVARPKKGQRHHLEVLQAFAEHGEKASLKDCFETLRQLRETRDETRNRSQRTSAARRPLQQWGRDVRQHDGFAVLRQRLLEENKLSELSCADLSRLYNQLRKLGLQEEATKAWSRIAERIADGSMSSAQELLGVWRTAPAECLVDIDAALEKALKPGVALTWQLLTTVARVSDAPEAAAIRRSVAILTERLKDVTSGDLAFLGALLRGRLASATNAPAEGPATDADGPAEASGLPALAAAPADASQRRELPEAYQLLVQRLKAELVSRGCKLETVQLVGLLGALDGPEDPLWALLRHQLLASFETSPQEFSGPQALDVFSTFVRFGATAAELDKIGKRLEVLLSGDANADLIALVSKNLEVVSASHGVCQSLFNSAVRMRDDLFPTILWGLFTRAGQVGLVERHPWARMRLERVGQSLERHGVKKHKLTLADMKAAAAAMKSNSVVLKQCLGQMAREFVDVHKLAAERLEAEDASTADKANLGEVQNLMISFWIQTRLLRAAEDEALTAVVESVSAPEGSCHIGTVELAQLLAELERLPGDEAERIRDGLTHHMSLRLPDLEDSDFLAIATRPDIAGKGDAPRHVASDISRRLTRFSDETYSAGTSAFDDTHRLVSLWAALSWAAPVMREYYVDNEILRASTEGLGVRFSKSLSDRDERRTAAWGSVVRGKLSDGWLEMQRGFLPSSVQSVPVLLPRTYDNVVPTSDADPSVEHSMVADAARSLVSTLPDVLRQEPHLARRRLSEAAMALSVLPVGASDDPQSPFSVLRRCLHEQAALNAISWAQSDVADLAFAFSALYAGRLPLDVATRLWKLSSNALSSRASVAPTALSSDSQARILAFSLAARHLTSPSAIAAMRLAPGAQDFERHLRELESKATLELPTEPRSQALVMALRDALSEAAPGDACKEHFLVPGTPYSADFAFADRRLLLLVPRSAHRAPGAGRLGGQGLLLERTLEALGWQVRWVWPETWESRLATSSLESPVRDHMLLAVRRLVGATDEESAPASAIGDAGRPMPVLEPAKAAAYAASSGP